MPTPTEASPADRQALTALYAAINSANADDALKVLDPEIVRIEPAGFPMSGTYRGHLEMKAHLERASATWAEGACTPEEFIATGDKVVVYVHVHVRLKDKTDWIDARIADGFVMRNGKVLEFRTFVKPGDALAWAGLA